MKNIGSPGSQFSDWSRGRAEGAELGLFRKTGYGLNSTRAVFSLLSRSICYEEVANLLVRNKSPTCIHFGDLLQGT